MEAGADLVEPGQFAGRVGALKPEHRREPPEMAAMAALHQRFDRNSVEGISHLFRNGAPGLMAGGLASFEPSGNMRKSGPVQNCGE